MLHTVHTDQGTEEQEQAGDGGEGDRAGRRLLANSVGRQATPRYATPEQLQGTLASNKRCVPEQCCVRDRQHSGCWPEMECGLAIGRRIRGGRCQSWRPSSRRIGRAMRAVLCLWALPGLAGVHWDRAMPFQGPANPAWALTITGSFSASTTYQCQFAPLATEGNPILTSAFSPEAGAASLVCTTPQWTYAAQRTRLSVLDVTTATPIAGPGGTAEVITYVRALSLFASSFLCTF